MTEQPERVDLRDEAATEALGQRMASMVRPGDFLALNGDLGSGKTTFVRGLARGLGIAENLVASPTFITMQTYAGPGVSLVHIDVWKMKDPSELETIGWDDLLSDQDSVIVVEWASRIHEFLPAKRIDICLDVIAATAHAADARRATIVDHRTLRD